MQRQAALLSNQLDSLQRDINDHDHNGALTKVLSESYPYPIPPFPVRDRFQVADNLLRRRLVPKAEDWIADRLSKATEFCDVPKEWDVQPPKKRDAGNDSNDWRDVEPDDEEDARGGSMAAVKRVKGSLSEDQLMGIWDSAYEWSNEQLQSVLQEFFPGMGVGDEDEEAEEDEMEDVIATASGNEVKPKEASTGKGADDKAQPTKEKPAAMELGKMLEVMNRGL
jgi:hypothetical protein